MAWPTDEHYISVYNFPRSLLPCIKNAIEKSQVVWHDDSMSNYDMYSTIEFEWCSCKWKLCEICELVSSISLIEGTLNQDLTAEVLKL